MAATTGRSAAACTALAIFERALPAPFRGLASQSNPSLFGFSLASRRKTVSLNAPLSGRL